MTSTRCSSPGSSRLARRRALGTLLAGALAFGAAGCEPTIELELTVAVAPETQEAVADELPVAVVVKLSELVPDLHTQRPLYDTWIVGVVCQATADVQLFEAQWKTTGCAAASELGAWLVPIDLPCDATLQLAPRPMVAELEDVPPWADGLVFEGEEGRCRSVHESALLDL